MNKPETLPLTLREFARLGGKARQAGMNQPQRRRHAQKAARARWKKWRETQKQSAPAGRGNRIGKSA